MIYRMNEKKKVLLYILFIKNDKNDTKKHAKCKKSNIHKFSGNKMIESTLENG